MIDHRARLVAQKNDLIAALETLEGDLEAGDIDDSSYRRTRDRYEREAAAIFQQLQQPDKISTKGGTGWMSTRWTWLLAAAAVAAALGLFLASALGSRTSGQTITGSQPVAVSRPANAPPAAVAKAEKAVRAHPKSYDALIALGNAWLDGGDTGRAEQSYTRAQGLQPNRPEAPTLSALLLASSGKEGEALTSLHKVERRSSSYARAWFVDGLISSRHIGMYQEAVSAWSRFLRLTPQGAVADQVRTFLGQLCRVRAPGVTAAMRASCIKAEKA